VGGGGGGGGGWGGGGGRPATEHAGRLVRSEMSSELCMAGETACPTTILKAEAGTGGGMLNWIKRGAFALFDSCCDEFVVVCRRAGA
jgi:hypothetical protein